MKKKLISIFLVLAMLMSLVACTPNTTAYLDASKKVSSWKGSNVNAELTYNFEVSNPENGQKVTFKLPASFKGQSEGQEKAKITVTANLKDFKAQMTKLGAKAEELKNVKDSLSFDIFVDKDRVIFSKDLFTSLSPEFAKDIKENYIELPSSYGQNQNSIKYFDSEEFKADLIDLYKTALPNFKPSTDIQVKGNTYTYKANIDDILADLSKAIELSVSNWDKVVEKLMPMLEKAQMPNELINKDEISKFKDSYKKEDLNKTFAEIKNILKGSSINQTTTFEDNKVTQNSKITVNVENSFKFTLDMKAVTEKDENAKVIIPTDVKKLTQKDLMSIMGSDMESFVIIRVNGKVLDTPDQAKIVNNRTMIPCRSLFESLGSKVSYDKAKKEVTLKSDKNEIKLTIGKNVATVNGKEVKLDTPATIIENKTYLPVRFVAESLGYKVKYQKEDFFSTVDLYNVEDSKLDELIKAEEKKALEEAKKSVEEAKKEDKAPANDKDVKKEEDKKESKDVSEDIKDSAKEASKLLFSVLK